MIHSMFSLTHENMQTCGGPSVTQRPGRAESPLDLYWWSRNTPPGLSVPTPTQIFYFCLSFLNSACQKCWGETFSQYRECTTLLLGCSIAWYCQPSIMLHRTNKEPEIWNIYRVDVNFVVWTQGHVTVGLLTLFKTPLTIFPQLLNVRHF